MAKQDFERIQRKLAIQEGIIDQLFRCRRSDACKVVEKKLTLMEELVADLPREDRDAAKLFAKWKERIALLWQQYCDLSTNIESSSKPKSSASSSKASDRSLRVSPSVPPPPPPPRPPAPLPRQPRYSSEYYFEPSGKDTNSIPSSSSSPSTIRSNSWLGANGSGHQAPSRVQSLLRHLEKSLDRLPRIRSNNDVSAMKQLLNASDKAYNKLKENILLGDYTIHGSLLRLATSKLTQSMQEDFVSIRKGSLKILADFLCYEIRDATKQSDEPDDRHRRREHRHRSASSSSSTRHRSNANTSSSSKSETKSTSTSARIESLIVWSAETAQESTTPLLVGVVPIADKQCPTELPLLTDDNVVVIDIKSNVDAEEGELVDEQAEKVLDSQTDETLTHKSASE